MSASLAQDWEPLAAPNPQVGATLFEALDAARTGIGFVRNWQPPAERAGEISGSFTGGGVCIGDFDNDGDEDVFLSCMEDGGCLIDRFGAVRPLVPQ